MAQQIITVDTVRLDVDAGADPPAVIGFLALGQVPHSWEIAGIVCVAVAVAVRTADPDEGEVESATDR